ncbi:MAG: hypothetical protein AAF639_32175 [Chloroflexota bacterium]
MQHDKHEINLNLQIPKLNWGYQSQRWLPTPGNVLFTLLIIGGLVWGQNNGVLQLLAAPTAQQAQSTGTIPYQGRLAGTDGTPVTDTVNMSFNLYANVTGGAPLWTEHWTGSSGVQVSDGLFNVMLGSLTPIDQSVITGNDNLFLGITVATDEEMAPRVQLGSVPFAVQALTVPDGSITNEKLATTTYYLDDNEYHDLTSDDRGIRLSNFALTDVPAGDMTIYCSFIAKRHPTRAVPGTVSLATGAGDLIAKMPTHIFGENEDDYVIHGQVADFAGGDINIQVIFTGEGSWAIPIKFGIYNSDSRFGRKCTVTAGL